MTLFGNKKLFLNINPNDLDDTTTSFTFRSITIDENVAEDNKLEKIYIFFVRNAFFNQSDNTEYFNESINIINNSLSESAISSNLASKLSSEGSNYELNKIIKYSENIGLPLTFEHGFDITNITDNGNYELEFSDNNFAIDLLNFYKNDKNEEFKFFLQGVDENNNVIDSTEIFNIRGYNFYKSIKFEYDEVIPLFKSYLKDTIDMEVTENGFTIKNHLGDFNRDDNLRQFDPESSPSGEPGESLYADRSTRERSKFRDLNTFPNLNRAYINFIINRDRDITINPQTDTIASKDFNAGYRTPWIFGGEASVSDSGGEPPLTGDNFLDDEELHRFNIQRNIDSGQNIKLLYLAGGDEDNIIEIDVVDNRTVKNWQNSISFFVGNLDFAGISSMSTLKENIMIDFANSSIDEFKFKIRVPYKLKSYAIEYDENNFIEEKEVTISKAELGPLINNINNNVLRQEIQKYFTFQVLPTSGRIIQLSITRTEELLINSPFFTTFSNTAAESNNEPMLIDIQRAIDNNNALSVFDIENKRLYTSQDLNNEDEIGAFINLGTNSYLKRIANNNYFFELTGEQTSGEEISGEIILVIKGNFDGNEVVVNFPVDIVNFIDNDTLNNSFVRQLLPSNGMTSINFKANSNNNLYDFDIRFNKSKLSNLNQTLGFGGALSVHDRNNIDAFKNLVQKMLLQIDYVKHKFSVSANNERKEFERIRIIPELQNFLVDDSQELDDSSNVIAYRGLIDKNNDLGISFTDLDIQRINSPYKEIIEYFINDDRNSLSEINTFNSISYTIEVKFRNFILPKGLNDIYNNTSGLALTALSYNSLSDFNELITDSLKSQLHELVYNRNPSHNNHRDIVTKWFSRRFTDDRRFNGVANLVKDYFMTADPSYLIQESNPITISSPDLDSIRLSKIQNQVQEIDSNLDYVFYNLMAHNNRNFNDSRIQVSSNIRCNISRRIITSNPVRRRFTVSRFRSLSNEKNEQVQVSNPPTTGNIMIDLASTGGSPYIDLETPDGLFWEGGSISNVEVKFLPEIVDWNLKPNYAAPSRYTLGEVNDRRDYMYKFDRFWTFNISNANTGYDILDNNRKLRIRFVTNSNSTDFYFGRYLNYCNDDNDGVIREQGRDSNSTRMIEHYHTPNRNNFFSPPGLLLKTFIVRSFMYRIRVHFTNGKNLYVSHVVENSYSNSLGSFKNDLKKNPMRLEYLKQDFKLFNRNQPSGSDLRKINNGEAIPSHFWLHNLAFIPYDMKTDSGVSKYVYDKAIIRVIPGYNVVN